MKYPFSRKVIINLGGAVIMEAIFNRRSVRKYTNQAVEEEKIIKLLKAAMQAPSAGNQQPWEFIVVQKKDTLKELSVTS